MKRLISLSLLLSLSAPVFASEQTFTEDQARQLVKIEKTPILLQSHIRKQYSAYKISVVSQYPGNLQVNTASLDNGVSGSMAASGTATSYLNVLWGIPLAWLGIGIAAAIIHGKNEKAESESFQFSNQIPTGTLHKNESISFKALVPVGQEPQVKLRFEDPKTGLSFAAD